MAQQLSQLQAGQSQSPTPTNGKYGSALERNIWKYNSITDGCENPVVARDGKRGVDAHVALSCSVFTVLHIEAGSEHVFLHAGQLLSPL